MDGCYWSGGSEIKWGQLDQRGDAGKYFTGPEGRKSVEPMAAVTAPARKYGRTRPFRRPAVG
jgi:hypothetical protein